MIHIAAPRARCFDLARSVEMHVQSTDQTGEVAIGGRTRGLLELGDEVTWRARHFGVWQTLTSRIVAYERPGYFRDSMVRGPFARLDHDHYFVGDGRGGTAMRDVVEFAAPLGLFGRVAEIASRREFIRVAAVGLGVAALAANDTRALAQAQVQPPYSPGRARTRRARPSVRSRSSAWICSRPRPSRRLRRRVDVAREPARLP
jgi:ligand-binding SRPBCC domain-containing protein